MRRKPLRVFSFAPAASDRQREGRGMTEWEPCRRTGQNALAQPEAQQSCSSHSTVETQPDRHVLVTHGTDTMVETAKVLAGIPGKVIVLTAR
jgi:uncharacterized membrane protein